MSYSHSRSDTAQKAPVSPAARPSRGSAVKRGAAAAVNRFVRPFGAGDGQPFAPDLAKSSAAAYSLGNRNVAIGRKFRILGMKNITSAAGARLRFGTGYFGFVRGDEPGLIRVRGRLSFEGSCSIGAGAQWDLGPNSEMTVGADTYFSPLTRVIVQSSLSVGAGCAISWDTQILDSDFHWIGSFGEPRGEAAVAPISIGDHCWIGSGVTILKGVTLPEGTVVAAGSTVTKSVAEPHCLIGGSPARVLRTDVAWS